MILALETSGAVGSVALLDGDAVLGERTFDTRQEAVCRLPGAVAELLAPHGGRPALSGLAVSRGPGSFNGLRVGVAMAKAMAHAWERPVVGLPTPEVWAAESAARFPGWAVAVLQPCRRDHVYLTMVVPAEGDEGGEARRGSEIVAVDELQGALSASDTSGPLVLTGDWPELAAWAATREGLALDAERSASPSAVTVARLARWQLGKAARDSYYTLRPDYVSPSQAERNRGVNLGL